MPKARKETAEFDAALGLGSNLGDKAENIRVAIRMLTGQDDIRLVAQSRLYRSPPWGGVSQDDFVNACITIKTALAPLELLRRCQAVEAALGRLRETKWGPRTIDVDVLTFRNGTIDLPELKIPHPYIAARAFVLLPLQEVAPSLKIAGATISELAAKAEKTGVEPL